MTLAEIKAYKAGVQAALDIAKASARAIRSTSKRPVHEEFAVAALAGLVEEGRALLLPLPGPAPAQAALALPREGAA